MGFLITGYNNYFGDFRIVSMNIKSKKDYKIYKNIVMNPKLMKSSSLFNGLTPTEEQARQDFELKTKSNDLYNIGFAKILDKDNNVLGIAGLIIIDIQNNKPIGVEIGVFLEKKAQSRGLFRNIMNLLKNFTFSEKDIKYILATSFASTFPSQIELLKLHFKYFYSFFDLSSKKRINCFLLKKEDCKKNLNIKNTRRFIKNNINSTKCLNKSSEHNDIIRFIKKLL